MRIGVSWIYPVPDPATGAVKANLEG